MSENRGKQRRERYKTTKGDITPVEADVVSGKQKPGRTEVVVRKLLNGPRTRKSPDIQNDKFEKDNTLETLTTVSIADNDDPYIIERPYDPLDLAEVVLASTRLSRATNVMARNTVGLGYSVIPSIDYTELPQKEQNPKDLQAETKILRSFLEKINPHEPFSEVMCLTKHDEYVAGNGYLEVVRDLHETPKELVFLPSATMWRRDSSDHIEHGADYVQIREDSQGNEHKVYFKTFGDHRIINKHTGKVTNAIIPIDKRATEVIHFFTKTTFSDYYGYPIWLPTLYAILGNVEAQNRTIAFLKNDCTPRFVIVANTRIEGYADRIEKFLSAKLRGSAESGRALVLQPEQPSGGAKPEIKVITFPLPDDASFLKYRKENDREISEIFGLADTFFGVSEDVNKASADLLKKQALEQDFAPETTRYEYRLNRTVVPALGCSLVQIKLNRPRVLDALAEAQADMVYIRGGAYTINELRDKVGNPGIDQEWADLPLQVLMQQVGISLVDVLTPGGQQGDTRKPGNEGKPGNNQPDIAPATKAAIRQEVKRMLAEGLI